MVDTYAAGKTQAVEPSFGSYVDTWNLPVNANSGIFDAALSGTTTINVSSATPANPYVNVTFSQYNATTNPTPWTQPNAGQNLRLNLTGTLTFNITILLQPVAGFWIISNNTVGNYSVTIQTSAGGGTSAVVPQGYNSIVFSDGTNVGLADNGVTSSLRLPPLPLTLGYLSTPINYQTSAYVPNSNDRGVMIVSTSGGVTVPAGVFIPGDVFSIANYSTSNQTVSPGTGATIYLAGYGTTGPRTLLQYGMCTLVCVAVNSFIISGQGLL